MNKLLIVDTYFECYQTLMGKYYPDWQVIAGGDERVLKEQANDCSVWFGLPNKCAELLKLGVKTPQWIQSTFAGIAPLMAIDLPKNYLLSRAVGVFDQLMAEYVLTYLLAHERQVLKRFTAQQSQTWISEQPGTLHSKHVLIVGAGTIGVSVAKYLKPFGVNLLGIATTARKIEPFEKVGAITELASFASEADYIINLLPDTVDTHNIYTAEIFSQMKDTAVFINAGRGVSVVDSDLINALKKGRPSFAVLDVFRVEPLVKDHPFWTVPHLLITEHTAAISTPSLIFDLFSRNLKLFEQHERLIGQVNFMKGY